MGVKFPKKTKQNFSAVLHFPDEVHSIILKRRVTAINTKLFSLITFYPMMNHSYHNGSELFQNDNNSIYRVRERTVRFV